ncbi:MAG TPA: glycosyltransferase family 39 protein [Solirubrobacteraceae bacterium]|nr:glycosyltransferase family 39 protein [Solirubrobacteraceae bacterium]
MLWLVFVPASQIQTFGGDGRWYRLLASNLVHHGVFSASVAPPYYESVWRAPGYPAFVALLDLLGASHTVVVEAGQFAVVAAMAIVVGLIGRAVVGPVVGMAGAILAATYLPFLEFATRFMTEDLASLCLAVVVLLLLAACRSDRLAAYAGAGLGVAVLTYVRPEFILFVIPVAVILVASRTGHGWRSAGRWLRALVFVGVFGAALLPWTIRNAVVTHGRVVPMATTSGVDLLASADQYDGYISYKETLADWHKIAAQETEIAPAPARFDAAAQVRYDAELRAAAIRIFRSLSIGQVVRSLPRRFAYMWGTADSPGRLAQVGHRAGQLQYVVLVLLGLVGFVIRRRQFWHDWPLWISAAYLSTVHLIFSIDGRYTLPARPMLMVYSAVGAWAAVMLARRRVLGPRTADAMSLSPVSGTVTSRALGE